MLLTSWQITAMLRLLFYDQNQFEDPIVLNWQQELRKHGFWPPQQKKNHMAKLNWQLPSLLESGTSFWLMPIAFWQPVPAPPTNFCPCPNLQLSSARQSGLLQIQPLESEQGGLDLFTMAIFSFPTAARDRRGGKWAALSGILGGRAASHI